MPIRVDFDFDRHIETTNPRQVLELIEQDIVWHGLSDQREHWHRMIIQLVEGQSRRDAEPILRQVARIYRNPGFTEADVDNLYDKADPKEPGAKEYNESVDIQNDPKTARWKAVDW